MNTNKSASMYSLSAPRLRYRRIARVYFFPWIQLVGASILTLFGWRIGIPLFILIPYFIIITLCCVADDLTVPQSRIMRGICLSRDLWQKLRKKNRPKQAQNQALQVFFTCIPPPFFAYRRFRWVFSLTILLTTWGVAWVQSFYYQIESITAQQIFTQFLFVMGTIPYAIFIVLPISQFSIFFRRLLWYLLAVLGPLCALFSLHAITKDMRVILLPIALFVVLYTTIFIIQRLWLGRQVLDEVIRDISQTFLSWFSISQKLCEVPGLLGERLKFDRVFILEPTPNEQNLRITAEFGDYQSVKGHEVPVNKSLTGRAFLEKASVVQNDVGDCSFYYSVSPEDDDTRAEIAIPIEHHGTVYAVLDIQSNVKGAYSPGDIAALETIARILGAAIAVDKREQFFQNATEHWQHIMKTSNTLATEQDVFNIFAESAQKLLGADLLIYYPLSLAGFPVRFPFVFGQLNAPELLREPVDDLQSSLIQLVAEWRPYFEAQVTPESLVARLSTPNAPSFVERESISATCFLPVGTYQERLGALFINFRQSRMFDDTFRFSALSLAQSLAQATAQVRYRDVIYKSFGRPEINVHSIISRYGFKKGVANQVKNLQKAGEIDCCASIETCQLHPLISQVDNFVVEMRLADSAHPPDFWENSLRGQLETFRSALPYRENDRRPRLKLDIDDRIELEYPLVKLALYRVITESVSNAILHGGARHIHTTVRREPTTIEVEITNDGRPLPPDAEAQKSNNGIYALLHECDRKLGAVSLIANIQNEAGVRVMVAIPALPLPDNQ